MKEVASKLASIARSTGRSMERLAVLAAKQGVEVPWWNWFTNDGQPIPQRKPSTWSTGIRSDTCESKWEMPENMEPRYDRMFRGRIGRV
jgi:hypothetical protein